VTCGNVTGLNSSTKATWSTWVYVTDNGICDLFGSWDANELQMRAWIQIDGTPRINVRLSGDGTSDNSGFDNTNISALALNTWHHICIVYDGTLSGSARCKLYLDSTVLVNSASAAPASLNSTASTFCIGVRDVVVDSFVFEGNQDEVSIWDVAFDQTDIDDIYNLGCPANLNLHSESAGLIHWWRMGDDDTYPTLSDWAGSNDGTMVNMDSSNIVYEVPCPPLLLINDSGHLILNDGTSRIMLNE